MIRFALPLAFVAPPLAAHGVHAPVATGWHGAAHMAVSAGIAALTAAAVVAVLHDLRCRVRRRRSDGR